MNKNRLYLFLLLLAFTTISTGQERLKFTSIETKDGLSSDVVKTITKDNEGFIWIGTENGLNRYDGKTIKAYFHHNEITYSLPDNTINHLFNTSKNQLLIATDKGFCEYNHNNKEFENHSLIKAHVKKIVQRKGTNDLVFATDIGLFIFSEDFKEIHHYTEKNTNIPSGVIQDVVEDNDGTLWVTVKSFGVFKLAKNSTFEHVDVISPQKTLLYTSSLLVRKNGDVLLAIDGSGLLQLDTAINKFKSLACSNCSEETRNIISVYEDTKQRIWVSGGTYGLALYDDIKHRFYFHRHDPCLPSSINSRVVSAIYDDNQGGLWVGTLFQGLNFSDIGNSSFKILEHIEGIGNDNIVCSILEEKNKNKWISTDEGIAHLTKENHLIHAYNTNVSFATMNMAFDADENIWGGTYLYGLHHINAETHKITVYKHRNNDSTSLASNIVWYTLVDSKGDLWVATSLGISKFHPETETFTTINSSNSPIKNSNTRTIFEDKQGNYWFGTEEALYRYDKEGNYHEYTHNPNDSTSLCNNWVITIAEDIKGNLWFGTFGGGISTYHPLEDNFSSWNEKDGLCNNYVSAILCDNNNNLWISTQKGLSEFIQTTEIFKTNHIDAGLQFENFYINASCKTQDGSLLFGSVNGMVSFDPDNIGNPFIPKIVFTDFKLNNKPVDPHTSEILSHKDISQVKNITLPYDYTSFTILFSALNYIQSEKNQYAYTLEGFNEDWIYINNKNEATYTNLSPGTYTFKVKASNNTDLWTKTPLVVGITVEAPFYDTPLFRLLTAVFIGLLLLAIFKLSARSIIRKKNRLERVVKQRTRVIKIKNNELRVKNLYNSESLEYAQLIQQATLPTLESTILAELEVLYLPINVVSGDFYWKQEIDGKLFLAAVDCTGHGVPGAFMSFIGHVTLNNIINFRKVYSPEKILKELHYGVERALNQNQNQNHDGMDISLVVIDKEKNTLEFAGAMNPLVYIQNNEMTVVKGDKQGIGGAILNKKVKFTKHTIDLSLPTIFYLFSDGFQDQFGGDEKGGKKIFPAKFRSLLYDGHKKPLAQQMKDLKEFHANWKGKHEQTDDILVMAAKV